MWLQLAEDCGQHDEALGVLTCYSATTFLVRRGQTLFISPTYYGETSEGMHQEVLLASHCFMMYALGKRDQAWRLRNVAGLKLPTPDNTWWERDAGTSAGTVGVYGVDKRHARLMLFPLDLR